MSLYLPGPLARTAQGLCSRNMPSLGLQHDLVIESSPKVEGLRIETATENSEASLAKNPDLSSERMAQPFVICFPQHRALFATSPPLSPYSETKEKRSVKPLVPLGMG